MQTKNKYLIAGIFFLILEVLVILKNLSVNNFNSFLWFCDLAPIIFSIAFFLKNEQLIKGIINIALIPQLSFFVALFLEIFLKINFISLSDIFDAGIFYIIVSFMIHLISSNLALALTYKVKPKPISLLYSFLILTGMLMISLHLASISANVNFVSSAGFLGHTIPFYTNIWVFLVFIVVVLPDYFIQYGLYRLWKSHAQRNI